MEDHIDKLVDAHKDVVDVILDADRSFPKQSADNTDDKVGLYFLDNFKRSLVNLKVNDKKVIESLTEVAGIGYDKASEIVRIIVNNESSEGLLNCISLIQSSKGIADYDCKKKLFMLRQTWNGVVSESTLTSLDIKINEMDRNWPVILKKNPAFILVEKEATIKDVPQTTTDQAVFMKFSLPENVELSNDTPKENMQIQAGVRIDYFDPDFEVNLPSTQELLSNVVAPIPKRVTVEKGKASKPICSTYDYNSEDDFEKTLIKIKTESRVSIDDTEKNRASSQEVVGNAILPKLGGTYKAPKFGRPKDDVWSFVKRINGKVLCKLCEKPISAKAVRIRKHLNKCHPLENIQIKDEEPILQLDGSSVKEKAIDVKSIQTPATQNLKSPRQATKQSTLQGKSQNANKTSASTSVPGPGVIEVQDEESILQLDGPSDRETSNSTSMSGAGVIQLQDEEQVCIMCHFCGLPKPKLKCEECEESFCITCFSVYHNHPQRKSHLSKEIVEPSVIKEVQCEWINTTEKLSIPKELWSKIYDIKEGKIVTKQFTFYKNEIGDLLEEIVKCVILVRDQYLGKSMTIWDIPPLATLHI